MYDVLYSLLCFICCLACLLASGTCRAKRRGSYRHGPASPLCTSFAFVKASCSPWCASKAQPLVEVRSGRSHADRRPQQQAVRLQVLSLSTADISFGSLAVPHPAPTPTRTLRKTGRGAGSADIARYHSEERGHVQNMGAAGERHWTQRAPRSGQD